ncbi:MULTISPECIES: DUF6575 domain-containing protein [Pseudoalteromonas]|uniref:DUF6575 domain-containing protein n=1 Tax=Pseudoalteromonas TaxID=53246 RepID=UPI00057A8BEE|nr:MULTISPECIES: DUF6575 domain-containing protein [Pseudoalteromonas]ATG57899.1 hypothetical protein CPA52_06500 [Pseudoalteromonas marina]
MKTLPNDTFLGRLTIFEIYDEFYGPKCFSVKDELQQLYLVYWSGDYDNGRCSKWVYMPVSKKILDELLREEYTFKEAYKKSKRLMLISTYASEDKKTDIIHLNDENLSLANLPPDDFAIYADEIQSIDPEAQWDFNLRIAKHKNGKGSPSDNAVTKVLDAFGEIIRSLMKDAKNRKPSLFPLTAGYSSFDVKLGSSNQERAAVAIELLETLLADENELENRLAEYEIDPYRLKNLLDIVSLNKLNLTLKSKTSDTLKKPILINSAGLKPILDKLEKSTVRIIDSNKVPQANYLDRVVIIVKHRIDGGELKEKFIDGISSQRQVDYHTHAAQCLGLLNKDNTPTTMGRVLAQKCSKEAEYQFLADRVESSDFGFAWMQWAGVKSISELDPDSSKEFVEKCVKGLERTSIDRRASSLKTWIKVLKPHRREYSQ